MATSSVLLPSSEISDGDAFSDLELHKRIDALYDFIFLLLSDHGKE